MDWIGPAIAAVAAVLVAVIEGAAQRERRAIRQDRERVERRAERRARESKLSMDLMYATCALSLTTAKKMAGQKTNGDVEEAMDAARAAQTAYVDFLRIEAAGNVAKT